MTAYDELLEKLGPVTAPTGEQIAVVRRTAAGHAIDADDLRTLMAMLGLGEGDGTPMCGCGAVISRIGVGGYACHAAGGMCRHCTEQVAARRRRSAAIEAEEARR